MIKVCPGYWTIEDILFESFILLLDTSNYTNSQSSSREELHDCMHDTTALEWAAGVQMGTVGPCLAQLHGLSVVPWPRSRPVVCTWRNHPEAQKSKIASITNWNSSVYSYVKKHLDFCAPQVGLVVRRGFHVTVNLLDRSFWCLNCSTLLDEYLKKHNMQVRTKFPRPFLVAACMLHHAPDEV